jgi:zinc protease
LLAYKTIQREHRSLNMKHVPGALTWITVLFAAACTHVDLGTPAVSNTSRASLTQVTSKATAPVAAIVQPAKAPRATSVEGIDEFRLPNGMQVLLAPDDSKPTTTVNLTFRVGSKHENYGETGMAHLLEHLIFKGTPTTKNVWSEFTRRGLRANGTTWTDRTNYFASFAQNDDNLRWYLSWLADASVNSFIARADLDSEMTVVRNEMELGENDPQRVTLEATMAAMYTWHNYGKSTIGARSDVENVDIARLQAFYRMHYQPDNATLVVAGKFDPAATLAWIEHHFGAIPKPTRTLPKLYTIDPVQDGERQVTVRRTGGTPSVLVGWHMPPGSHPDFAAAQLLASILGEPGTGRFHKQVVVPGIAAAAYAFPMGFADPSPFFAGLVTAPGQSVDRARAALLGSVDRLKSEPITQAELDRARIKWINAWERGFTNPEEIGVELTEAVAKGDWRLYFVQRDQVRQLTLADVQRVANEYFRADNRTVSTYVPVILPERAPKPVFADVAAIVGDYKGDPSVAKAEAFDATPAVLDRRTQTRTLASGLKVALLPKGTRGRVVSAQLRLNHGDEASLRNQAMAGAVMGAMLDHGGAGLTREQLKDRFDALRADVSFAVSGQQLVVTMQTVREHLPQTLALVTRVLKQPALSQASLEEVRKQTLASIETQRKEPDALISQWLSRHGNPYPRGHVRHANTFEQTIEDLQSLKLDAVKAYAQRFVSASQGEFSAVGDMDAAAVNRALDEHLGSWRTNSQGAAVPFVRVPNPLTAMPAQRHVAVTPDKQNANLRAALPMAIDDKHADFPALLMANALFGRGGSSRLWVRVRETDGLSYDVRSGIEWSSFEPHSRFVMSAIFAPENQAKVELAIKQELVRALKDGFTQVELDDARVGLLSARRLNRAQDDWVTGQLVSHLHVGRSFAFDQQVDEAIGKLTLAQINAAFRQYIKADAIVYAWGGDFKQP